jgi:hypothetical protein
MGSRRDGYEAWERLVGRDRSGEGALGALSDIGELRRLLESAELDAVRDARGAGKSWTEIVGLLWPQARAMLHECGLTAEAASSDLRELSDPEMADYLVITQRPRLGRRVARGSTVRLWLASDPGDAGVQAPLTPPPDPHSGQGAIDQTTGHNIG